MLKRLRHQKLSIFVISRNYYEVLKRTMRANGNISHNIKPKNFSDFQSL